MTSPPETDREYAYFSATGVGDAKIVDDLMNMNNSEYWNIGDQFELMERKFSRKYSCWRLDSGYDDTHEVEKHIEALLLKLGPKLETLNKIRPEFELKITCVGYTYQSFGFELPFELQRQATSLGIGFSFDFYPFGDIHEDIVEMRAQLKLKR